MYSRITRVTLSQDSLEPVSTWRTKPETPSEEEGDKKRALEKTTTNNNNNNTNNSNSSYSSFTLPLKGYEANSDKK